MYVRMYVGIGGIGFWNFRVKGFGSFSGFVESAFPLRGRCKVQASMQNWRPRGPVFRGPYNDKSPAM